MNKILAPALLLAAIALGGCSQPAPAASAPAPDTRQLQKLTTSLMSIKAELANPHSVDAARNVCSAILAGKDAPAVTELAKAQFVSEDVKSIDDKQAAALVDIVRQNGFCPLPPA